MGYTRSPVLAAPLTVGYTRGLSVPLTVGCGTKWARRAGVGSIPLYVALAPDHPPIGPIANSLCKSPTLSKNFSPPL